MSEPKFSIVVIAKNEAKTLPRLLASLSEFKDRGGDINILDTGSTDETVKIAKEFGCKVEEVGDEFLFLVGNHEQINKKIVDGEENIVNKDSVYFDFAMARNRAALMASKDIIFCYDADEVSVTMDIDAINKMIDDGATQFEYNFVFAYDQFGNEAVRFIQCKAYDRRIIKWEGIVHELLIPYNGTPDRRLLDESIYKLGHHQNHETGRHTYLIGLAVDCFRHPDNDRHSHYLARELMWAGRTNSALKEFKRHVTMGGWPSEKAQSYIFMGDCYGKLNLPHEQVSMYSQAFHIDSSRRESIMKLAHFYKHNNVPQAALCYAVACLEIPYNGYYANEMGHYTHEPHEVLYWAYGWLGNIDKAREHLKICLDYQPYNTTFLRDTKFYFEYFDVGIDGWMLFKELTWLYEMAKSNKTILEVGSWKGRSTHALLTGCKNGTVTAVDTWEGSIDNRDMTSWIAKQENIFAQFNSNVGHFTNLKIHRKASLDAAKDFADDSFDAIFIDAGHTEEEAGDDIDAWLPKCKRMLCGHDYIESWMGVIAAVDKRFGKPDGVCGSIWYIDLVKRGLKPDPSKAITNESALSKFTKMIDNNIDFTFVKLGDGEMISMLGNGDINGNKNVDGSHYFPKLGKALLFSYKTLLKEGAYFGNMFEDNGNRTNEFDTKSFELMLMDYTNSLLPLLPEINDCERKVPGNLLLHQPGNLTDELHDFYAAIRNSNRRKVFIGPAKLNIVSQLLVTDFIEIPETDAFLVRDEIAMQNFTDCIVLISAGMAGKVFINDIVAGTIIDLGSAFDPFVDKSRSNQVSKDEMYEMYSDFLNDTCGIPKMIYTVWLSEDAEMPDMIKKCIASQQNIPGYEHKLITLDNYPKYISYVNDAIKAKKWVKAVDYLRAYYLCEFGGIFMDADMEILPGKNFDSLITPGTKLFAAKEENGFVGYSLVGSVPGHTVFQLYLDEVNSKFKGDDDFNFESSMEIFTHLAIADSKITTSTRLLSPEYFFPYNHQTGMINVTPNTIAFHHFMKSWVNSAFDLLPRVSILLPTLGREEGLKKCLESIDRLYYPKHLIETIVIPGEEDTVPQKVAYGLSKATGDVICYAANDMEFTPTSLYNAVNKSSGLVAFNTGELLPDNGNICEHFIIRRWLIEKLGGEIFSTKLHHVGVDNLLWAKASKLGVASRCDDAIIIHNHFSKTGKMDHIYEKGWSNVKKDREILNEMLLELEV